VHASLSLKRTDLTLASPALDPALNYALNRPSPPACRGTVDSSVADSFVSAIVQAESLEHFHLFRSPPPPGPSIDATARSGNAARSPQKLSRRRSSPAPALELHTDVGLFIVMTAAEVLRLGRARIDRGASGAGGDMHDDDDEKSRGDRGGRAEGDVGFDLPPAGNDGFDSGLRIELPSGEIVRPTYPAGSLLVLNGEGGGLWLRAAAGAPRPYAPAHEVVMPTVQGSSGDGTRLDGLVDDGEGDSAAGGSGRDASTEPVPGDDKGTEEVVRVWFGRMFLPPNDARFQPRTAASRGYTAGAPSLGALTFGEYRRKTYESFRDGRPYDASTAGETHPPCFLKRWTQLF